MARHNWQMQLFAPFPAAERPSQTALAQGLVGEMDLLRLKTIARLHARGLPPEVGWDDLLQEAFTRVLSGARIQPPGVPLVAFLAGIMRSLRSEHWRRARRGAAAPASGRRVEAAPELAGSAPDPECSLMAAEQLVAIERLFAQDPVVLRIIAGLAEGLSAEQIRNGAGLSKTEYDSARRRMRRGLLREGLTCAHK
jgi:DNA-directed RNA polymerase specialized sigma24 family protein